VHLVGCTTGITVLIDDKVVLHQRRPNLGCDLHCYKCFLLFAV